jgi:hypothetical protein
MSSLQEKSEHVRRAIQLLHDHQTDPSSLMIRMDQSACPIQSFLDETTQTRWNFMIRRRSRLFLLAKSEDSPHYVDIHSMSTK